MVRSFARRARGAGTFPVARRPRLKEGVQPSAVGTAIMRFFEHGGRIGQHVRLWTESGNPAGSSAAMRKPCDR